MNEFVNCIEWSIKKVHLNDLKMEMLNNYIERRRFEQDTFK